MSEQIGRQPLPSSVGPSAPKAPVQRLAVLGLLALVILVAIGVALYQFIEPEAGDSSTVVIDGYEEYVVGGIYRPGEFLLVRLEDRLDPLTGQMEPVFLAFDTTDPRSGCALSAEAGFFRGDGGQFSRSAEAAFSVDALRDPCHGSAYDISGQRVFGPSAWNLDRFPIEVRSDEITVDLGTRMCSAAPGISPAVETCGPHGLENRP